MRTMGIGRTVAEGTSGEMQRYDGLRLPLEKMGFSSDSADIPIASCAGNGADGFHTNPKSSSTWPLSETLREREFSWLTAPKWGLATARGYGG
jgi:hypothetical protein